MDVVQRGVLTWSKSHGQLMAGPGVASKSSNSQAIGPLTMLAYALPAMKQSEICLLASQPSPL
jgi:hypothetical protein